MLAIVFYSLYRVSKGSRGTQPSRLVRLLARDGEDVLIGPSFSLF